MVFDMAPQSLTWFSEVLQSLVGVSKVFYRFPKRSLKGSNGFDTHALLLGSTRFHEVPQRPIDFTGFRKVH